MSNFILFVDIGQDGVMASLLNISSSSSSNHSISVREDELGPPPSLLLYSLKQQEHHHDEEICRFKLVKEIELESSLSSPNLLVNVSCCENDHSMVLVGATSSSSPPLILSIPSLQPMGYLDIGKDVSLRCKVRLFVFYFIMIM